MQLAHAHTCAEAWRNKRQLFQERLDNGKSLLQLVLQKTVVEKGDFNVVPRPLGDYAVANRHRGRGRMAVTAEIDEFFSTKATLSAAAATQAICQS